MLRVINVQTGAIVSSYVLEDETITFDEYNPHATSFPPHVYQAHEATFDAMLDKRKLYNESARRQARSTADTLNAGLPCDKDQTLWYAVVNTGDRDVHMQPEIRVEMAGT